jgi:threonine/homoserine/homoserine lactone efflux protein
MLILAHAGHWLISLIQFAPAIAFLIWLGVVQVRRRREPPHEGAGSGTSP